jgi:hypothetical protein
LKRRPAKTAPEHHGKAYIHNAATIRMYSSHGGRTKPRSPITTAAKEAEKFKGKISMSAARMTMMTAEDIRTEFGWDDDMIHFLLKTPDSTKARRCKGTGGYAHEHYYRKESWPSLNRRKAAVRNGDGMRRYVASPKGFGGEVNRPKKGGVLVSIEPPPLSNLLIPAVQDSSWAWPPLQILIACCLSANPPSLLSPCPPRTRPALPGGASGLQLGITDQASPLVKKHLVASFISFFKCFLLDLSS